MPISAPASRASSRSSRVAYEPRPGGTPLRAHLDDAADGVAVLPCLVDAARELVQIDTVPATSTPISRSSAFATAPAATVTAVCRALARSSASRTSSRPNFIAPARSAWPGRGVVTGVVPFPDGSPSGGHGLMPQAQFA